MINRKILKDRRFSGACIISLGNDYAGLWSFASTSWCNLLNFAPSSFRSDSDELAEELIECAKNSVWFIDSDGDEHENWTFGSCAWSLSLLLCFPLPFILNTPSLRGRKSGGCLWSRDIRRRYCDSFDVVWLSFGIAIITSWSLSSSRKPHLLTLWLPMFFALCSRSPTNKRTHTNNITYTRRIHTHVHNITQLKSKIADLKNVGGRAGGSITAALFLKVVSDIHSTISSRHDDIFFFGYISINHHYRACISLLHQKYHRDQHFRFRPKRPKKKGQRKKYCHLIIPSIAWQHSCIHKDVSQLHITATIKDAFP